jgi:hypothetical protein
MYKLVFVSLVVLLSSCARDHASNTQSLGETTTCDGGTHSSLLFQVIPGTPPEGVSYVTEATVTVNGVALPRTFTVASGGPIDEYTLQIVGLETGDTFIVSASFDDGSGGAPVTCERTWTAVAPGSIGCGPVEIGYFVSGTCQLICD